MEASALKRAPYPANVVEFARRMYEAGYSPYRIHKALHGRGWGAAEDTIRCWVDPAYAEARAMKKRNGRGFRQERLRGFNRRLSRLHELRAEVCLSYRAIAALLSHDFEDIEISEEQVRAILNGNLSERKTRRLLWPKGANA